MKTLPTTSPEHYLTGQAALNIPMENGDFADWHFTQVFLQGSGRFFIAGENFLDTSHLLGSYGIRECSEVLRGYGLHVPLGQKVFAANYIRAMLDLIISAISKGKIPYHVTLDDTLDSEALRYDFQVQIQLLKQCMSDKVALTLLERWEQQQK